MKALKSIKIYYITLTGELVDLCTSLSCVDRVVMLNIQIMHGTYLISLIHPVLEELILIVSTFKKLF